MGGLEGARYGLLLREPLRGPRYRPRLSPPVSRRGGRRGPAALTEVLPTLSGLCPRSPNRSHEAVSAYQSPSPSADAGAICSARPHDLGERFGSVLGLLERHLREQRHAEHALAGSLGVREAAGPVTEAGVSGLQVDRPRIVN